MLGQYGLLPDAAPANLPPNAWTSGNNVRFNQGQVQRSPAFRTVDQGLLQSAPVFVMPAVSSDGTESLIIANEDGNLTEWTGGTETDVTPTASFTAGTDSRPFTGCTLGNVQYVNRPDRIPYGKRPTDSDFTAIPAWDINWRASSLRSFGDYLIAINVTKSALENPQLLHWSDTTLINEFPASFDETDPTKLAGETPLSALRGPLIDGLALKNAFILYGKTQSFIMTLSNDQFVFSFDKLFDEGGIISQNCAVEVEGRHYVFGPADIYMHDGVTKLSIADEKVKDFIFQNIDLDKTERFFVVHDPYRTEVLFCFASLDADAGFEGTDLCNRAAAFNYSNSTWSFRDLPNVAGAAVVSADAVLTWANAMGAWNTQGGSWSGSASGKARGVIMVKPEDDISAETIIALDGFDINTRFLFPLFAEGNKAAWVRRVGLDLSALGLPVRDYKVQQTLLPLITTAAADVSLYVKFGAALTPAGDVTWGSSQSFNPNTDYKVDNRVGGRFIALEFGITSDNDFKLAGYDFDLSASSHR